MVEKELLAIAFSDLHLHRWKAHSKDDSRLVGVVSALQHIRSIAQKKNVPLLFNGDFIHNEKAIENKLLAILAQVFSNPTGGAYPIHGISGNHDMSEKNTADHPSPSYISTFSSIFPNYFDCLDFEVRDLRKIRLFGIPYMTGNLGFGKIIKNFLPQIKPDRFNILMLHTDLPGASDAFGHEIGEVENLRTKYFRKWDLVLAGHIHKPQKLGKNIWMLGSPYQQTRSEKGLELGYWEIYRNHKPKLIPLGLPKFIDLTEEDEIPNDGNFYTVIPKPREFEKGKKFDAKLDRVKLAKKYLKHTNIEEPHLRKALIKILNTTE